MVKKRRPKAFVRISPESGGGGEVHRVEGVVGRLDGAHVGGESKACDGGPGRGFGPVEGMKLDAAV